MTSHLSEIIEAELREAFPHLLRDKPFATIAGRAAEAVEREYVLIPKNAHADQDFEAACKKALEAVESVTRMVAWLRVQREERSS